VPAATRDTATTPSKSAAPPIISTPPVTTNTDSLPQNVPASLPNHVGSASPPPPVEARKAAVIVKGESLQRVQPEYPARARAARQWGAVAVEVSINERGDVIAAQALSGPTLLRDAAVAAARRWRFKPATRDGKPISSVTTITFNFKM
jgi:protein TonB